MPRPPQILEGHFERQQPPLLHLFLIGPHPPGLISSLQYRLSLSRRLRYLCHIASKQETTCLRGYPKIPLLQSPLLPHLGSLHPGGLRTPSPASLQPAPWVSGTHLAQMELGSKQQEFPSSSAAHLNFASPLHCSPQHGK